MAPGEGAERIRAGDNPDEDEPDHRRNLEAGKGRDHDAGCAEDHQSIAKSRGSVFACHAVLLPF